MPVTVYEKNHVEPNKEAVFYGKLTFNKIDETRTPAPNDFVREPKPEYALALTDVKSLKGDENLIKALKTTMYGEQHEFLSLRDKSPYSPMIFDSANEAMRSDVLIPKGKALKNGQSVYVHVHTFESYGNVGCGFDAIKLETNFSDIELQDTGRVAANVFDI